MKQLFLFKFLLLLNSMSAQYVPMDIPLFKNGTALENPWAGGLNLPQFSEVDLNNDGIQDLVSYDREGKAFSAFINGGTAGVVDYQYAPEYTKRLPLDGVQNFMLFRDYNCDGIEDIFGIYFIYAQGTGVAVWEGSYDANDTIQYTLKKSRLYYNQAGSPFPYQMSVSPPDLPAIDDVDGDGDIDILVYGSSDPCFRENVFWLKNVSVENGHNCDSLEFVLESECWGLFRESGDSSKILMGPSTDSCYMNEWFNQLLYTRPDRDKGQQIREKTNARNARHNGTNLTMIDYNGDNVKDLLLGEISYKNVNMISGVLINDTVLITTQDYRYPVYDEPVDLYSFPASFFLDVNNDGLKDMLITPSDPMPGGAVMDSVAWYYQNTGSNSNMIFDFQQKDFLVGGMLDVGRRAFPALFDYNADGKQDILVGGYGRCQEDGSYQYGMTLLENTGTLTNPSYEYVTNDYASADSLQMNGLYPTLGDLDGDGDVDMLCGGVDGSLIYFENNAGAGNLASWNAPVRNYAGIDLYKESAPFLVDLDRDMDLDLLVGHYAGTVHYYENTGSTTNPVFSNNPVTTNLGGYSIQAADSRNTMPFVYDHNGSYEMYIGHQDGNIIHLGNIDADILGTYDTLSENFNDFYQGTHTHISVADLDNDNKLDYILGTGRGGLMVMTEKDTVVNTGIVKLDQKIIHLYPNPAKDELTIHFLENNKGNLQLTIYNALGQIVLQNTVTSNSERHQLDISTLPSGVLFLNIETDNYQEVVRFVKH